MVYTYKGNKKKKIQIHRHSEHFIYIGKMYLILTGNKIFHPLEIT